MKSEINSLRYSLERLAETLELLELTKLETSVINERLSSLKIAIDMAAEKAGTTEGDAS